MYELVSTVKRDYIVDLARQDKRTDARVLDQYREVSVEIGLIENAQGSALVKIGNTQVLVGIKMDIGEPFSDSPNMGVLSTAAELVPLASPDFESGPPREDAIELARVVDRGVRESKVVDIEKLVVTPGEKVWLVFIDIHILDYDGNLFDAASLGALAALSTTVVPAKRFEAQLPEGYPKEDFPLPMSEPPISCTVVKIKDFVLFDPCFDEEIIADVRLTVATDHQGDIRAMQKGLSGGFSKEEIQKVIKGALDNGKEIRNKLKAVIS